MTERERSDAYADELAVLLVARLRDGLSSRGLGSRWIGRSSDAMLLAAINGSYPIGRPYDGWDLGRCLVTRAVAPPELQAVADTLELEAREQEARRIWRVLAWNLKARLEAVEEGVETFEEAFLAHLLDETTGETVFEQLARTGRVELGEPLLPQLEAGGEA